MINTVCPRCGFGKPVDAPWTYATEVCKPCDRAMRRDIMTADYDTRYTAINDALWLIQRGPTDPNPPEPDPNAPTTDRMGGMSYGYLTGPAHDATDPRYAEISLALDIARFLMCEENPEPLPS